MDRTSLPVLEHLAASLDVALDDRARERFDRYRSLLLDWNRRFNLTRVTDPVDIEVKLFADALAIVPIIRRYRAGRPATKPLRLIDVGSGAGFPGLPLKIVEPELEVTLLEATGKKVAFLDAAIAALELDGVRAIHARAEDAAHDPALRARFDVVTARGVARLPALVELCLPFCRVGGWGIFPKGSETADEVARAGPALDALGGRLIDVVSLPIPELSGTTLVIVEQVGPAPDRFPRRPGIPTRHPIGARPGSPDA